MLSAEGYLTVTACSPGLEVSLPFLLEVLIVSGAVVLCMFHGPQYVSSAASLPGGVKLPVTNFWLYPVLDFFVFYRLPMIHVNARTSLARYFTIFPKFEAIRININSRLAFG